MEFDHKWFVWLPSGVNIWVRTVPSGSDHRNHLQVITCKQGRSVLVPVWGQRMRSDQIKRDVRLYTKKQRCPKVFFSGHWIMEPFMHFLSSPHPPCHPTGSWRYCRPCTLPWVIVCSLWTWRLMGRVAGWSVIAAEVVVVVSCHAPQTFQLFKLQVKGFGSVTSAFQKDF